MSRALVTGASAGIGAEFAAKLAATGYDLVLVARNADRLAASAAALRHRYGVTVEVLPADLADPEGCGRVEQRLTQAHELIDLLVNNAGCGVPGTFLSSALADEEAMLDLNVRAVLRLTHAALPGLRQRHGGVINVSSMAGFVPTSSGASYAASKAWVTMFSESLAMTLAGTGVRVTAVCPGYTASEFHDRIGKDLSDTPRWLRLRASQVVNRALVDHRRGRVISIPGRRYRVVSVLIRLLPRRILTAASARVTGHHHQHPE